MVEECKITEPEYSPEEEMELLQVSNPNEDLDEFSGEYIDFDGELHLSKERLENVRMLLRRYKAQKSTEEENLILANAMESFKLSIEDETDERAFTVLLLSYFRVPTLTAFDISRALRINDRTVFKDITKGVKRLCVLIFGISAFTVDDFR